MPVKTLPNVTEMYSVSNYQICEESGLIYRLIDNRLAVRIDGMVKNINRLTNSKNFWNNGYVNGNGYRQIRLNDKMCRVHRLVGELFIPNPEGYPYINHIDGDKSNNHINNLEWTTARENIRHSFANGLQVAKKSAEHHCARKIGRFSLVGELLETYHGGRQLMEQQGYCPGNIYKCCKGKLKEHKGFIWRYLDE